MRIGNIEVSDEWLADPVNSWVYGRVISHCKICNNKGKEFPIIISNESTATWYLTIFSFPKKEYELMYGNDARYSFTSLSEAKDHVDSFLVKLEKLMVFL